MTLAEVTGVKGGTWMTEKKEKEEKEKKKEKKGGREEGEETRPSILCVTLLVGTEYRACMLVYMGKSGDLVR